MENISFDSDEYGDQLTYKSPAILAQQTTPKMVKLLTKSGIVKDERKAAQLLTYIIIATLIAAIVAPFLIISNNDFTLDPDTYFIDINDGRPDKRN